MQQSKIHFRLLRQDLACDCRQGILRDRSFAVRAIYAVLLFESDHIEECFLIFKMNLKAELCRHQPVHTQIYLYNLLQRDEF